MIRKAIQSDIIQASKVLEEVKIDMLREGVDQWDQEYPNKMVLQQDIDKEQAFIYEEQGELVAYMALNEKCDEEYNDLNWNTSIPFLVIHRLYVKPVAQGKGLSSKMIRYAEQYAVEHKYQSIRFDAFSLNETANAVYLKKGYHLVGTVNFRKGVFNCYEKAI
ncbi:GNAT family N-acetyltransferase [Sphingobacterium kitahiroshimense]|uniref:GNAT family N-acetyltransferase n=1 Tax=Sphingobacterium sp. B16(2022) TaxID=2914044 RepID=UPI00143AECC3|nr:GNAT family N-acetyltransferase [Sphingobacterium sp. B16(2022)]NJI72192.1 GNAT family N-acetyltransferase [Sphingobacterium sp. B16(2022)]